MACKNSPRKSVYCGDMSKPANATIIAELTRARCEFQLRAICAAMALTPTKGDNHE